jgi:drug/metabolite transporter (DMT)-like permease
VTELIATVIIWGLSFALAKKALNQFTPFELVTIRLALGALTASILFKITEKKSPKAGWAVALILGLFEFAGTYILYTWSLSYLPSGVVGTLTLLTPVLTFVVGFLFGVNPMSWRGFLATLLSLFGAAMCFPIFKIFGAVDVSKGAAFGFCLLMVSNLLFAVGNVIISKLEKSKKWSQGLTAKGLAWGVAFAFMVTLFTQHSPADHFSNLHGWILPIYLGVVATGLGFFLWNKGVQKVSAFPASVIGNFKGPLSVLWGVILLGEHFDFKFVLGLILLFLSTQLVSSHKLKRP